MEQANISGVILLHSPDSIPCQRLSQMLGGRTFNGLTVVRADTPQIKDRLERIEELHEIPALIIKYTNGRVLYQQGKEVFDWFNMILNNHQRITQHAPDNDSSDSESSEDGYDIHPPIVAKVGKRKPYHKVDPFPPTSHEGVSHIEEDSNEESSENESEDDEYGFRGDDSDEEYGTMTSGYDRGEKQVRGGHDNKQPRNAVMDAAAAMAAARDADVKAHDPVEQFHKKHKSRKKR